MTDPMEGRRKMAGLLRLLRTATNGAVVGAMAARGTDYPLSYGVAVAEIRRVAAAYAPDHDLARLLYTQDVRELRLAALYVADPAQVALVDAPFWAAGITCGEVAEHAALMLGRSPVAEALAVRWLGEGSVLLRYAALLIAARAASDGAASGWDLDRFILLLDGAAAASEASADRALVAFAGRLWRREPASHPLLRAFTERLKATRPGLANEICAMTEEFGT